MTGTVDFRLAIKRLLEVARGHGHVMGHIGSFTIKQSDKTEHVKGLYGDALWVCQHGDCKAATMVMCSDGTDEKRLGLKGTVHQVLNTPPAEYRCGVPEKPLIEEPHRFPPGSSTLQ